MAGVPDDGHEVGGGEVLAPEQVGDEGGQDVTGHKEALGVVAMLEHEVGVLLKVGHVDGLAGLHDCRVLPHHQPTHVGKEEATVGIVGISHGLTALVVEPARKYKKDGAPSKDLVVPVVAAPGVDRVLAGHGVRHQQQHAQGGRGLGATSSKPVKSREVCIVRS